MTQPFDLAAQREFVDNDDGYKLVRERHNKMHEAARSARADILHELRKINMLLMAFDLCVEKAWEHEDVEEDSELDKQLKRLTSDSSDIWFGQYNAAAELIKQQRRSCTSTTQIFSSTRAWMQANPHTSSRR